MKYQASILAHDAFLFKTRMSLGSALLLGTAWVSPALAGSVTLSGAVDQYVAWAKAGSRTQYRVDDGGNIASRINFKGTEDLGDGLRANFLMESGLNADTGTGTGPGPEFGWTRQIYVGLAGTWGSVDLGRMYTPVFYGIYRADPFGLNVVFSPLNLVSAIDGQTRMNPFAARGSNMARYRTPIDSPLIVDLAWAPGESQVDSRHSGDLVGGRVGWTSDSVYLGYGLQRAREGSAARPVAKPATSKYQAFSGSYKFSEQFQLSANFVRNTSNLDGVPAARITSLGASWTIATTTTLLAEVARRELRDSPRGQVVTTLGVDYFLSKRTLLYARALGLNNRGGSSVSMAQVAITPGSDEDTKVLALGMRHSF
ncbi:MAG TPA: porin [Ideonella sp.]|uniref:porin n=1 Tax=Ideonella sp. TaxID=1929293 RepID=UPI002D0E1D3A|nr:porin [Ideonella sp.]HSI48921.1 porin [Ideonella sp.]